MESDKLKAGCYIVILFLSIAASLSITADLYFEEEQCYDYGLVKGETCYTTWKVFDYDTGIALHIEHKITSFHNSKPIGMKKIFEMESDLVNRD